MIGVAADPDQMPWVAEFFELFKTPWEPMAPGKHYPALLIVDGRTEPHDASLAFVYGARPHPLDTRAEVSVIKDDRREFTCDGISFPIYGAVARFGGRRVDSGAAGACSYTVQCGSMQIRRVGYDLFDEVAALLTTGQPDEHAEVPTLEHHIALLRQWLAERLTVLEVPPRPAGHDFICCLTHDIDFFGIRRHRADRTLAGFVTRGTLGTAAGVLRGRRSVGDLVGNVAAVATLPLVFTGLARDFWQPFDDYARADRGHARTYFLIPFKDRPGIGPDGVAERRRAVAYDAREIAADVRAAAKPDVEFAVHGIDAWRDAATGREELQSIASASGAAATGVRMHWLYNDEGSPARLEAAGFSYDSTWGYNAAVGFRAGTMQAFKLPGTTGLMELPLTLMDTAMLYKDRMGLAPDQANDRASAIVNQARRHGGALVVNWHDRSLAPERRWGACYEHVLDAIERHRAWFATAGDAVEWFRWRRSIRFDAAGDGSVRVFAPPAAPALPPAHLTVHHAGGRREVDFHGGPTSMSL